MGRSDNQKPTSFSMPIHLNSASARSCGVVLAIAIAVFAGNTAAQTRTTVGSAVSGGPFAELAGSWSGSGTIDLANGKNEQIRCRASYDVLAEQNKLQLNIRCASESYNFELRGSAAYAGGAITGNWSEATRNAAGTLSGRVQQGGFQVVANGPSFSVNLNLVTRGDKQSVTIRSKDANTEVRGVTITMQRG
jgi:hypothetical protein